MLLIRWTGRLVNARANTRLRSIDWLGYDQFTPPDESSSGGQRCGLAINVPLDTILGHLGDAVSSRDIYGLLELSDSEGRVCDSGCHDVVRDLVSRDIRPRAASALDGRCSWYYHPGKPHRAGRKR